MTRAELLSRYKREIQSMRQGIEWMQEGKLVMNEQDQNGNLTSLNEETIEHCKRTIATLEEIVAKMEAVGYA